MKIKKIILIILIFSIFFASFYNTKVFAKAPGFFMTTPDGGGGGGGPSPGGGGDSPLSQFNGTIKSDKGKSAITNILSASLQVIRIAGSGIAIIIIIVIGIKYAIASAGERADIKKYAITYVIGALILFGASGILGIIKQIIDEGLNGA